MPSPVTARKAAVYHAVVIGLSILAMILPAAVSAQEQKPKVLAIEVEGNHSISAEEILGAVETKVGDEVSEDKIKGDLKRIYELGYFFKAPTARTVPYKDGVKLIYEVTENPKVTGIEFSGNRVISSGQLQVLMTVKPGEVLNVKKLNGDLERVLKYYYNEGYSARISDVTVSSAGVVGIQVKELTVGQIKVEGNTKTKPWVILRESSLKPGDIFNINKVRDDQRHIFNLGIFETVDAKLDLDREKDAYDVTYVVKERRTGTANLGVAWNSAQGFIGYIDVSEDNFLGKNQRVSIRWDFGAGTSSYELGFFEPWLDAHRTSFGLNLYNKKNQVERMFDPDYHDWGGSEDPPEKVKYTEQRKGGNVQFGRPLGKDTRLYLTFRLDDTSFSPITSGLTAVKGGGETRSITVTGINDTRDNFMNPTSGSRKRLSIELAGGMLGGDYTFGKYELEGSVYHMVRPNQVLALHMAAGFSSGELPSHEQYKLGGAETIRGYKYGRFYGDKMFYANGEYRFRIVDKLQGVIFVDSGTAWENSSDTMHLADLKTGVGAGVRIDTPIGLIRIDYGTSREGGQAYLSIGQMF
ncbi:MAG TPA: BamA/TamA family outer membrane protein [Firmicutes bacterium]|nr:BamA/TamA family outer membrane protein [Bacillota bacterium]